MLRDQLAEKGKSIAVLEAEVSELKDKVSEGKKDSTTQEKKNQELANQLENAKKRQAQLESDVSAE